MADITILSSRSSNPTARYPRLLWQSRTYNDEGLLQEILRQHSSTSWTKICDHFNRAVPVSRQRSMDAVVCKGKKIRRQERSASINHRKVNAQLAILPDTIISIPCYKNSEVGFAIPVLIQIEH